MTLRARIFRRSLKLVVLGADRSIEEQRAGMERAARLPRPKRMAYSDIVIGGVPALRAVPTEGRSDRHILYLHGGGYMIGSPRTHIAMAARLARRCVATVTVPDYRLAPEHPYPAAIDDCVAAYRALAETVDPRSIVIAGDSAGGGATLATLGVLKQAGDTLPACAYVLSPWTDLTSSGETITTMAGIDPMIDPSYTEYAAKLYAVDRPLDDPGVSPHFADLSGFPPLLVQAGSDEVLRSDSTRLAERAHDAGVEVELEVAERMWHVYQAFAPMVPEANRALDRAAIFITAHARATS